MKKFATLFIFMGMVLISIAQGSLQDGWVQLNNGDTLYGKILEKDWNLSPSHIDFYHPDPTKYGIEDLQSFGITGGDIYKRFVVQRHLLPYNENNDFPEDESQVDSIKNWLKMILQAKVSLAVLYQEKGLISMLLISRESLSNW